jgi:hypothetical protein
VTDRSIGVFNADVADGPWKKVSNYFDGVADLKPTAADYAISVRKLYDLIAVDEAWQQDTELLREILLSLVSAQLHRGLISKQHDTLVAKLLPEPTPAHRGRGRPKKAFGKAAQNKKYVLYRDWIYTKARNPSLTKEQFAKQRLGITDEDLAGEYSIDRRAEMDAYLQALKPARMKQLHEGYLAELELACWLLYTEPQALARKWQEAKQHSPALTKQEFLQKFLGWRRNEINFTNALLEVLERGEKFLTRSKGR